MWLRSLDNDPGYEGMTLGMRVGAWVRGYDPGYEGGTLGTRV